MAVLDTSWWNNPAALPPDINPEREAAGAMAEAGYTPPRPLMMDGKPHRFKTADDRKGGRSGWYSFHLDGSGVWGVFGDWRLPRESWRYWRAGNRPLSDEEAEALRNLQELTVWQAEQERQEEQDRAAERARAIWDGAREADDSHGYLQAKGVKSHGLRLSRDGRLIVPIRVRGVLRSLQFIRAEKGDDDKPQKQFLRDGEVKGGYFIFTDGDPAPERVYIAEGYATAATVYEATGGTVLAAMNAGNLEPVALFAREVLPEAEIILVADHDKPSQGYDTGTGERCARKAAEAVGGKMVMPPQEGTDANDYAAAGGDVAALLGLAEQRWLVPEWEYTKNCTPIKWLIKGIIQQSGLHMLFGPSGCGKTFIALDWAMRIAGGADTWAGGHTVNHGPVVYLAGEGHEGLRARLAGWKSFHAVDRVKMWVSRSATGMNTPEGLNKIIREIRRLEEPPVLVVVDTVHRFFDGDENKAQDVGTMLKACETLTAEFNCAVLLVHHSGVGQTAQNRARGSSAWRGALDIEIKATKEDVGGVKLTPTKSKDFAAPSSLLFDLQKVTIPGWMDDEGEQVTTVVPVEPVDPYNLMHKDDGKEESKSPNRQLAFEALELAMEEAKTSYGVGLEQWREMFYKLTDGTADGKRKRFSRGKLELLGNGDVEERDGVFCLGAD